MSFAFFIQNIIMTTFTITASSQPLYDTWGYSDYWGCNEWILWYKALSGVYGKEQADYIWSKAWLDGVSSVAGGNGTAPGANYITDSVPLDCRTFDSNFKSFLSTNTNLSNAVYSGLSGLIIKPVGLGVDVVNGVIKIGSNVVNTAVTTSNILKYGIAIFVIIFLIFILVFTLKKSKKILA